MPRPVLLAAAGLLLLPLAACTSGGGAAAPKTSAASQAGGAAAEPATAAIPPAPERVAAIRKQLLVPFDVPGYAKGRSAEYTLDRPCLKPTMVSAFPGSEQLAATLANGRTGAYVAQKVVVLADEPTARAAYTVNVAELACPGGILRDAGGALPVTIGVPQPVREVVGGDQATTWLLTSSAKSERARVVVVVAQVKDMVVDLAFSSDTEQTGLPDPLATAKAAILKLSRA